MFTLQTVPVTRAEAGRSGAAKAAGFSLTRAVAAAAHEREKLARWCRTIARPAVSTARLSLTAAGTIRYRLKTPYRDGTTDILFEPLFKIAGRDFVQPPAGPQGEGGMPGEFHGVHPCTPPLAGQPAAVQISNPADLSWGTSLYPTPGGAACGWRCVYRSGGGGMIHGGSGGRACEAGA